MNNTVNNLHFLVHIRIRECFFLSYGNQEKEKSFHNFNLQSIIPPKTFAFDSRQGCKSLV